MRNRKNRLDEMQEQKMLQIEHIGCWLAFYGLLIAMFVQLFLYGRDFKRIAGEWIAFMCLALYLVTACLKNGIWDRRLAPVLSANLRASLIGGGLGGIAFGLINYHEYHMLWGAAAAGIIIFVSIFAGCFTALSIVSYFYRERTKRLENAEEKEERGEEQD